MAKHARLLHPGIEELWQRMARAWQAESGSAQRTAAQLATRAWPLTKRAEFLAEVYGDVVPEDGVPTRFPWNGRWAALGHLVSWLTSPVDHPPRTALRPQWEEFPGTSASSVGRDVSESKYEV